MKKLILRVWNPVSELQISKKIKLSYRLTMPIIYALHVAAAVLALVLATEIVANSDSKFHPLELENYKFDLLKFLTIFAAVQIVTNIFLIWTSSRNEAIARQSLDLYAGISRSVAHKFNSFEEHILWLIEKMSPAQFGSDRINLCTTISTPIYGLGSNDWEESSRKYLQFMISWVEHFEKFPTEAADPPTWDIVVWNAEKNRQVFCDAIDFTAQPQKLNIVNDFIDVFERMYKLNVEGRAKLNLYFCDETHTRWFYVRNSAARFTGIMTVFSPLSPSAVSSGNWLLCGVSFADSENFSNLASFNFRLMHEDHSKHRVDRFNECFSDPRSWINEHYGIQLDQLQNSIPDGSN